METWKLQRILKETRKEEMENELKACSSVELEQGEAYNRDGEKVVVRMKEVEEELQTCILQGLIRRVNVQYMFQSCAEGVISRVQKRKSCCCFPKRIPLPVVDYSEYFVDSDWLYPLSDIEKRSRKDQLLLLESLQIQLRKVEDRLVCNDKVAYFNCILWNRRG